MTIRIKLSLLESSSIEHDDNNIVSTYFLNLNIDHTIRNHKSTC